MSIIPINMAHQDEHPLTADDKRTSAWKYVGYKDFSRFLGYSRSFFFLRKFHAVNARVLLAMQDSILLLEEDLNKIDNNLSYKSQDNKNHNGTFRREKNEERIRIIWKLQHRLKEYSEGLPHSLHLHSRRFIITRIV
jgi:hypothetical protein